MAEVAARDPLEDKPAEPWVVPASYAQERVWFASQLARDVPVYHIVDEFRLPYQLPLDAMRAALTQVCQRHETLRTSFRLVDDALMQVVHPQVALPVDHLDLSGEPEAERDGRISAILDELAYASIPLDRAPLWRGTLVRRDEGTWLLLFVAHHAVVDAASEFNLRAELNEICAAQAQGRPASLPDLPIQYADYAIWQRDRLAGGELDALLDFWGRELADLPAVHGLRTDRPRPSERTFAGTDVIFEVPAQTRAAVPDLARRSGATPFMVLFTAYAALLQRLSGQDDIVIGLPVAGRDRAELQPLIGMFVNMIVVRIDTHGDPTFTELLGRVRDTLLAAWDHQEMPYQKLVETLATHREPGVPPLYQLGFNYLELGFSRRSDTAEDDLMLEVASVHGRVEYNTALFDAETAQDIADGYLRVLSAATADPQVRISALPATRSPREAPMELPAAGASSGGGASQSGQPVAAPDRQPAHDHVAPRTAAEELVAEVWAEVLGVTRVGALDDFFDLGGHSLLALRVIARLSAAAGIDLPIQAFFADTTVAGVARELERLLTDELDELSEDEAQRLVAEEG